MVVCDFRINWLQTDIRVSLAQNGRRINLQHPLLKVTVRRLLSALYSEYIVSLRSDLINLNKDYL